MKCYEYGSYYFGHFTNLLIMFLYYIDGAVSLHISLVQWMGYQLIMIVFMDEL
jgi:hypothetical protein